MPRFTASATIGHNTHYQVIFVDRPAGGIQPAQAERRAVGGAYGNQLVCVVCEDCSPQPDGKITCTDCHPIPCPVPKKYQA